MPARKPVSTPTSALENQFSCWRRLECWLEWSLKSTSGRLRTTERATGREHGRHREVLILRQLQGIWPTLGMATRRLEQETIKFQLCHQCVVTTERASDIADELFLWFLVLPSWHALIISTVVTIHWQQSWNFIVSSSGSFSPEGKPQVLVSQQKILWTLVGWIYHLHFDLVF